MNLSKAKILLAALALAALPVAAQEPAAAVDVPADPVADVAIIPGADPAEATDATQAAVADILPADAAQHVRKKGLINRIIAYFDESNKTSVDDKPLDFSFIAGPAYSSDRKFSVALLGAALYKSRRDALTPQSNATLYAEVAVTGYYQVGIRGTHIGPSDNYRIPYDVSFESFPTYFWGIGYDNGIDSANKTKYLQLNSEVVASCEWRLAPNLYLGPAGHFSYSKATKADKWDLWDGQDLRVMSLGAGFNFSYDSRDNLTNPSRGWYTSLQQRFYPRFLRNGDHGFSSTEFRVNHYMNVWKGGILAFDVHGLFTYGNTPWAMLATFGGSHSMRGYYSGRYRDKCEADATVELRQHVWRRNGVVLWVGAGNVFPDFRGFRLKETLPNVGVGYRWEFKKGMNVRVDVGFGRHEYGFTVNINEAF